MNSMVLATDRFVNKSSWTGISSRKYLHANSLSNGKSADKSTQGYYVNDHATMIHCVPPTSAKGTRCKIIKSRCKEGKGLWAPNSSPSFGRSPHDHGHSPSLFTSDCILWRGIMSNKDVLFYIHIYLFCYLSHWTVQKTKTPKIHGTLSTNHWQHRHLKLARAQLVCCTSDTQPEENSNCWSVQPQYNGVETACNILINKV